MLARTNFRLDEFASLAQSSPRGATAERGVDMMIRVRLQQARLALQRDTMAMLVVYGSVGLWVVFWFGD
jgi:hypothetical protein